MRMALAKLHSTGTRERRSLSRRLMQIFVCNSPPPQCNPLAKNKVPAGRLATCLRPSDMAKIFESWPRDCYGGGLVKLTGINQHNKQLALEWRRPVTRPQRDSEAKSFDFIRLCERVRVGQRELLPDKSVPAASSLANLISPHQ